MPLKPGKSRKTLESNLHELRHGQTYQKTRRKFGKEKAQKQMVAIALSKQRGGKPRLRQRAMQR